MIHHDLTGRKVHTPFFRTYASAGDRNSAADVTSADVGKVALQTSDWTMWILKDVSPLRWSPAVTAGALGLSFGTSVGDVVKLIDLGGGRAGFPPDMAGVPAGVVLPFGGTSAPTGFLMCNGATISRTAYAGLFQAIGTHYGSGDGASTFKIPDMRGVVPRGTDTGKNLDPGRQHGSYQGDGIKSHTHSMEFRGLAGSSFYGEKVTRPVVSRETQGQPMGPHSANKHPFIQNFDTAPRGGTETRMKNLAMNFIIKF
ncbi:phage tail protein [Desulfobaculum bizertense]|uniref:phage tail protein n=1 Tax=Desulfobaculum bizertense TaxID=376490 RepID=UPI001F328CA2|nr:tail fiber protein [Desulfobaculum bizertense]UIJ36900.1 phage tail protein [Desulfobaculum bizertense]